MWRKVFSTSVMLPPFLLKLTERVTASGGRNRPREIPWLVDGAYGASADEFDASNDLASSARIRSGISRKRF